MSSITPIVTAVLADHEAKLFAVQLEHPDLVTQLVDKVNDIKAAAQTDFDTWSRLDDFVVDQSTSLAEDFDPVAVSAQIASGAAVDHDEVLEACRARLAISLDDPVRMVATILAVNGVQQGAAELADRVGIAAGDLAVNQSAQAAKAAPDLGAKLGEWRADRQPTANLQPAAPALPTPAP